MGKDQTDLVFYRIVPVWHDDCRGQVSFTPLSTQIRLEICFIVPCALASDEES